MPLLFIVARHQPSHFEFLKSAFSTEEAAGEVQIILDRRHGERRPYTQVLHHDRQRDDRRRRWEIDDHLRALGWAIAKAG